MTHVTMILVAVGVTVLAAGALVGVGVYFVRLRRAVGRVDRVEGFTTLCGWLVLLIVTGATAANAWGGLLS